MIGSCDPRQKAVWGVLLWAAVAAFPAAIVAAEAAEKQGQAIRVVVWDERSGQPAYKNFIGNAIADALKSRPGLKLKSVGLDEPEQGLAAEILDNCDVLIYWSHRRNNAIKAEKGQDIVRRIKAGQLSMIALHSAHWATPFVQAMYERTRIDALAKLSPEERKKAKLEEIFPKGYRAPKKDSPLTPSIVYDRDGSGGVKITIKHANCCFPLYRVDGRPGHFKTLLPEHPIAKGIPPKFDVARTEVYGEPFHVPKPDAVVFEERWDLGGWFRNGMLWKIGGGWVCYIRPGHETYPVYKDPNVLKMIENTVRWMASKPKSAQ